MIKATDQNEPEIHQEDVAGDYGFRCRYDVRTDAVGFMVFKVVERQPDGLQLALFLREGSDDVTPDIAIAAPYLSGAVKRDGRVWLTGESVFIGGVGAKMHAALQKHLFLKCYKFMGLDGKKAWEQEP